MSTEAGRTRLRARRLIYVTGGDNAANVSGDAVIPGSGGSKLGFKLLWDAEHNGDTFIDAVCAYRFP